MKDKIVFLIIGILLGAVISTGAFYVYITTNGSNNNTSQMQGPGGTPPNMPSGQSSENGELPEMPSGNNTQNTNQNNS